MNTLGWVVSVIVAFLVYGIVATIAAFLALTMLAPNLDIENFLRLTAAIGVATGILGAAVPLLRRTAISVLTSFAPSSW